ncbi:hypothetical protein HA402_000884 [Bradysia odoriphaga]|nr:hypothetical protein HA402_000884 [Bradysia odoriphaga]
MKCWIALFGVILTIQCISVRAESSKIFVGGLAWHTGDAPLRQLFETYGEVIEATVIREDTGRSRGFGIVTMSSSEDADKAIEALNDTEFDGRRIRVSRRER